MALRTDVYYRGLAQQALAAAGVTEPPVMLGMVARHLGVPVRAYGLPVFFGGAIVNEDGMPVIILNEARSQVACRATLAHLLGHLLVAMDEPSVAFPRDAGPHREADIVGAELILPSDLVLEESRKWFNDYRYVARLFAVAESEMLGKMREMGLIKDRGIYWDY